MQEIVVIDGEITLENVLDGEVELEAITDLDPEVVLSTGGAVYPHYSGSYEVTPSSSVQTLQTTDMVMDDDVTVQAVPQGSATTPATIITADPTISVSSGGLITATVSKTQQITPTVVEGYVETGTAGNVGVSGSAVQQLTTQGAQTIHPASTDQSIASGKYLTGAQTFKAVTVSGLTADKVLQGNVVKIGDADDDDRIMSVTGTASGGITPTGTKSITANGTSIDVYSYQYADVAVPNSYSAGDEGKVVSNGALVAQTSDTVTANDTYDTTLINSLTVNVSGGVDTLAARCNGTLTTYSSDAITTVANYAFTGSGIQSLELPNCTEIGSNGLRGLTALTNLKIHNVTKLSTDALNGSSALTVLAIPKCTSTTTRSFNSNTNLKTLEIATCSAQLAAVQLTTIILRKNSVVTLSATSNLNSTVWGSSGTGGTLYVPSDLVSSYQSASNWSTILGYTNNQIKSIESTHTDPTAPIDLTLYYADGSPLDE